jgi:hypothetical protein
MGKPFKFLFKKLTPAEFARVFEKEAWQTKAFLLSFAPNPEYVEGVIDIYSDKDFTSLITGYLSRAEMDSVDLSFIRGIEKHIRGIIRDSEKRHFRRDKA